MANHSARSREHTVRVKKTFMGGAEDILGSDLDEEKGRDCKSGKR